MMPDFLFLSDFPQLAELHLWGGQFYADRLHAALADIGGRLHTLFLIHTEQIDVAALRLIAQLCPRLHTLGFYNCEFITRPEEEEIDEDDAREPPLRPRQRRELELLLEVEHLAVVSECPEEMIRLLLAAVLNLETLKTGIHCHLADTTLAAVLSLNALQHLKVNFSY